MTAVSSVGIMALAATTWVLSACGGSPTTSNITDPPRPEIASSRTVELPIARVVKVRTGPDGSCAVTDRAELLCWGAGDGRATPLRTLSRILDFGQASPPPGKFVDAAMGLRHTCGLEPGGRVRCWGKGDQFEICHTDGTRPPGPRAVGGGDRSWAGCDTSWPPFIFRAIVGSDGGTVGLTVNGEVIGWGQIGETERVFVNKPYVAVGASHSMGVDIDVCALRSTGEVDCNISRNFVTLPGMAESLTVGRITCGLKARRLVCWRTREWRELQGHGVRVADLPVPRPLTVEDLGVPDRDYAQVSCGASQCCVRTPEGEILCAWTDTQASSQQGHNVPPPTGQGFTDISVSARHACAATRDGKVHCWGSNRSGQCDVPKAIRAESQANDERTSGGTPSSEPP